MLRASILLAMLCSARIALAACPVPEPHLGTTTVPLGCTVSVYFPDAGLAPKLFALRGDARVDVTGAVTSEAATVPVFLEDACTGEGEDGELPVTRYDIALAGAVAGDVVVVDGLLTGATTVVAASACPAPVAPSSLYCADDTPACDGGGSPVGCAASGSGGLVFGLLALVALSATRRGSATSRARSSSRTSR